MAQAAKVGYAKSFFLYLRCLCRVLTIVHARDNPCFDIIDGLSAHNFQTQRPSTRSMLQEGHEYDKEKTFVNHYNSFITRTQ